MDECADESLSQEPIVIETPGKRNYDEIAKHATRSTSYIDNNDPTLLVQQCWAMLLPFKQALTRLASEIQKLASIFIAVSHFLRL